MKKQMVSINLMVDKRLKNNVVKVLDDLGLSMSMAITIYLKQVIKTNSIPFKIKSDTTSKSVKVAKK